MRQVERAISVSAQTILLGSGQLTINAHDVSLKELHDNVAAFVVKTDNIGS